jgi:hypothetical protein
VIFRDESDVSDTWIATTSSDPTDPCYYGGCVLDMALPDEIHARTDASNDIQNATVSRVGNLLVAEFDRKANTGDALADRALDTAAIVQFYWALRAYPEHENSVWPPVFHHTTQTRGQVGFPCLRCSLLDHGFARVVGYLVVFFCQNFSKLNQKLPIISIVLFVAR